MPIMTKVTTKSGIIRNVLTSKHEFQLFKEMELNYVKSGLTDAEFAEACSKTLGFFVTDGNVKGARQSLEIKATIKRTNNPTGFNGNSTAQRLSRLEALVRAMRTELGMPNTEE